jgi:hypothetical protein
MVVGNNKLMATKNAGESMAISIAMAMQRYDAGRITRWITSGASLKATGCRHRSSARIISSGSHHGQRIRIKHTKH